MDKHDKSKAGEIPVAIKITGPARDIHFNDCGFSSDLRIAEIEGNEYGAPEQVRFTGIRQIPSEPAPITIPAEQKRPWYRDTTTQVISAVIGGIVLIAITWALKHYGVNV